MFSTSSLMAVCLILAALIPCLVGIPAMSTCLEGCVSPLDHIVVMFGGPLILFNWIAADLALVTFIFTPFLSQARSAA